MLFDVEKKNGKKGTLRLATCCVVKIFYNRACGWGVFCLLLEWMFGVYERRSDRHWDLVRDKMVDANKMKILMDGMTHFDRGRGRDAV